MRCICTEQLRTSAITEHFSNRNRNSTAPRCGSCASISFQSAELFGSNAVRLLPNYNSKSKIKPDVRISIWTSPPIDSQRQPSCPRHYYRSRYIYMITINAAKNMPHFSQLTGIPGNHDFKPKCNNTFIGETIAEAPVLHQKQFPFHKHSTARHHAWAYPFCHFYKGCGSVSSWWYHPKI